MSPSDNVVRAGLTQKHMDVETLCSMLTYKLECPEKLTPIKEDRNGIFVLRYVPPTDEFCVTEISYDAKRADLNINNLPCMCSTNPLAVPSSNSINRFEIGVVTEGCISIDNISDPSKRQTFHEGEAFCLRDGTTHTIIFDTPQAKVFIASENNLH